MHKTRSVPDSIGARLALTSLPVLCVLALSGCDLFDNAKEKRGCGCVPSGPFPGAWSTQYTSDLGSAQYRVVDFQAGGVYANTVMNADGSTGEDLYREKGTWRTHADTLFLEYQVESKNPRVPDPRYPGTVAMRSIQRFRVNDSGWLATIRETEGNQIWVNWPYVDAWNYFRPADWRSYPRTLPGGEFTAHASRDTLFAAMDTLTLRAWPGDAAKPPAKYLWSFDGGRSYTDTSLTGDVRRVWGLDQIGLHVVAVKGVDAGGRAAEPYYFEAAIHAYMPTLKALDQDIYCFADGRLAVEAMDTNGTVDQFLFGRVMEGTATDSGNVPRFKGRCLDHDDGFQIRARDDDGLYSPVATIKVRKLPAKTIGTRNLEFGSFLFRDGDDLAVFGGSGETPVGGGHFLMIQSLDAGVNTVAKDSFLVDPAGYALGRTDLETVAPFPSGGYLLAGGIDDTYGVEDSAYAIRLGPDRNPVWKKIFRDSGSVGGGYKASVATDGGFVLGGYTYFGPGGAICRVCVSYTAKLKLTRIDTAGTTVWNRLYEHGGDWYRMRMVADASGRIYILTDSFLMAVDKQGVELWSRPLGFTGMDMAVLKSGKIILAGKRNAESLLMEIDADGIPVREIPQGEAGTTRFIPLEDGGALLLANDGKVPDPDVANPESNPVRKDSTFACSVTRLDANLGRVWRTNFIHFTLADAQSDSKDGFTLLGNTNRFGNGSTDPVLLGLDKYGSRVW
jgi:hypothetical protein